MALCATGMLSGSKHGLPVGVVLQKGSTVRLDGAWPSGKGCALGICPAAGRRLRRTYEVETRPEGTAAAWFNRGLIVKTESRKRTESLSEKA